MNLISYRKGSTEVIDLSTRPLFAERYAGLGALIGPHFHHRSDKDILPIPFEERFPHIARVRAKGIKEPISHGIARYAPWEYVSSDTTIKARLKGSDMWEGVLLSSFEGFNFTINMDVELRPEGLFIELSVDAESPSVVGFHYYYALKGALCYITADCKDSYFDGKNLLTLPETSKEGFLYKIPIIGALDHSFYPKSLENKTAINLHTEEYTLTIQYQSHTEESSFQIFHPENSSYVCIEPLSATRPKEPRLKSCGVNQLLTIL
jgi:hypothetical protein